MKNGVYLALLGVAGLVAACGGSDAPVGSDKTPDGSDSPERSETSIDAPPGSSGAPESLASPYDFLRQGGIGIDETRVIWAGLPYSSISLERQGCFGTCPIYTVTFSRGSGESAGLASYVGERYAARDGAFDGAIDIWAYGHLCELLDSLDFFGLEENYAAEWTDDATVIVEASGAAGSHRVLDYGRQGPAELVALQLAIDATADRIEWSGVGNESAPPAD
jgi:hypothetical protein